jgi:hypothetical protein
MVLDPEKIQIEFFYTIVYFAGNLQFKKEYILDA